MIQKETENNKLIAEFLGFAYLEDFNYPKENAIGWYNSKGICVGNVLKFHCSWDWLMEVVEKIQLLVIVHDNTRNYDSVFKEWSCTFSPSYKTHDFGYIVGKSKNSEIEAVYNACIEFIKWYNEPTAKL